MDTIIHKSVYILLASLGLAIIFNFLFFSKLVGISVLIFVAILLGVVYFFGERGQISLKKRRWMLVLIGFFALMPSIRANEFLIFLNILATFGLLMLLAHDLVGTPAVFMKIRDYISLAILVPFRMLRRALYTLSTFGQIHSEVKQKDVWIRVLKGVVMAVPILIIFGALFSQADLAFSQFLKNIIEINISERFMQRTVLLAFAAIAGLSYLSYIFFPKPAPAGASNPPVSAPVHSGRGIEVLVFLGLISALFLIFIGFQLTYLFGGEANILNAGFTYAEYARRGFFELLVVGMLSLVILLAAEKYTGAELKKDKRFLIPAFVAIAEVVIVIISAFKRLALYIDAYGMTLPRFYVTAIVLLLLALFIILAAKFIWSKQEQFFTFGTLISVLALLVLINLINPDSYVAKANIAQYNETGKLDLVYIDELSVDAISQKLEIYNFVEGEQREVLRAQLAEHKEYLQNNGTSWLSANLSRSKARELLSSYD